MCRDATKGQRSGAAAAGKDGGQQRDLRYSQNAVCRCLFACFMFSTTTTGQLSEEFYRNRRRHHKARLENTTC